jgi:hypothetical protein
LFVKTLGTLLLVVVSLTMVALFAGSVRGAEAQPTFVLPGLNCGNPTSVTSQLVPLVMKNKAGHVIPISSYPFQSACKKHDQCYAHWGISRGSCDQAFGIDMHAVCQVRPSAARADCEYVGEEYHSAVVRKGAASYKEAQEGTVYKALKGTYTGLTGRLTVTGGPNGTVSLPWKATVTITPIEVPNLVGIFGRMTVTSPFQDDGRLQFEKIGQHPSQVTGTAAVGFNPPPGYVGGEVDVDVVFSWGGGVLPPSLKGTFSGGSLVADANGNGNEQQPVTFSGSVIWTKSHH